MKKQQGKGLLALLGIGAGVFAWWKYKNLSPEKKEELHGKINEVGQRVKETYDDVQSSVKNKYDAYKADAKEGVADIQKEVSDFKN